DSGRSTSVHRRCPNAAKLPLKFAGAEAQIRDRVDIAADPEIDPGHWMAYSPGLLRRISTPTSLAPRIAPGLLTRTCTEGTGNSSRINAAIFSARVSTSWKLESPTNCCTRLAIAL